MSQDHETAARQALEAALAEEFMETLADVLWRPDGDDLSPRKADNGRAVIVDALLPAFVALRRELAKAEWERDSHYANLQETLRVRMECAQKLIDAEQQAVALRQERDETLAELNERNRAERAVMDPEGEVRQAQLQARAFARAADTEKAEAKHWRERAEAAESRLAALEGRVDHVLADIDACTEADHCKYFGEWLRGNS